MKNSNKKLLALEQPDQTGFVLIFLAIAATAFVALLALTIDSYRLATSHSQERSVAQAASLAALERYREAKPTTPFATPRAEYEWRVTKAIERAEEVAGLQKNTLLGNPGTSLANVGDLTNNSAGTITAGAYVFEEPNGAGGCSSYSGTNSATNGCPCGGTAPNKWVGPCFKANDQNSVEASSFEVKIKTKSSSPIPFLFGRAIGYTSQSIQAPGRAAMVPRHGVYALDMSGSMTAETHLSYADLGPTEQAKASQYVFQIRGNSALGDPVCTTDGAQNPCINAACTFLGDLNALAVWNGMEKTRPATGLKPSWKHYRSDYTCKLVDIDNDGTNEQYLVDTNTHYYDDSTPPDNAADGFYRGPEPLSNILVGIHQALLKLEERQVAGDQIAVLAFDQAVVDKRPAELGRVFGYTHPGLASFETLKQLTDVAEPGNPKSASLTLRLNAGFFPRPAANTDIPEAVVKASDLLAEMPNNTSAQSYVALFTDGLSTCSHQCREGDTTGPCAGNNPWWSTFIYRDQTDRVKLTTDVCVTPPDDWFDHRPQATGTPYPDHGTGWWNGSSWNYHINSLAEVSTLIAGNRTEYPMQQYYYMQLARFPSYVDQRITFHALVFGKLAQPHTVLKRHTSDSSKCMDEADARKSGETFTWNDWHDYNNFNRNCYETIQQSGPGRCPYLQHIYEIYRNWVKPTGGYFVPIRPSCASAQLQSTFGISSSQCRSGALNDKLDEICSRAGYPGAPVNGADDPQDYQKLTNAGLIDDLAGKNFTGPNQNDYNFVYDSQDNGPRRAPRVICDTGCRTTEEQITEFVNKVYAQNPYVLVDPN
ncbi:MAG: hypothetical protein U0136_00775 [Bdellovibrionota bacterium]